MLYSKERIMNVATSMGISLCQIKSYKKAQELKKRDTLIKYKNELKQAGLIYELSRTHVLVSPSGTRLKKGFCTYFLPDTSESEEYNQEKLEQAIKDKGDLGIIARYMKC